LEEARGELDKEARFLRALWEIVREHDLECKCDKCKVWLKYFRFQDGKWVKRKIFKGNKGDFPVPVWEAKGAEG